MPGYFWDILEDHAKTIGEDRSSYLRKLANTDLTQAGKLPGSAGEPVLTRFLELLKRIGPDEAAARLEAWSKECAEAASR